jgi:hypothetical protein
MAMERQNHSIRATLHSSTENAAIFSSPHVFRRVQNAPSEQGFVEPSPPNPEGLTDEFFDKPTRHQNSLVIPNWTDELKRRGAQFQNTILATHAGACALGESQTLRTGQPAE